MKTSISAVEKKHKACIKKYKALILKYMAYIFELSKKLVFSKV